MTAKPDNRMFLQKMAEFANVAINEIEHLEDAVLEYRKKEAAEDIRDGRYNLVLEKAAKSLYDTDFITDEFEKRKFLKQAKEDPSYLAKVLIKVCEAADVALIGKPARVARSKTADIDDPVMKKAFGLSNPNFLEDLD